MNKILTLAGGIVAVLTALVAFYMVQPVDWDGFGKFGAIALFFPLHLLAVSVSAAGIGVLAWRRRARPAALIFGMVTIATLFMALLPSLAMWRLAREEKVPLSLAAYLVDGGHFNLGGPEEKRSVVYNTAPDGTRLLMDVWQPEQTKADTLRPAMVLVHGGAWRGGTRSSLPDWDRWLNRLGYVVFDIDYRMATPARWQDEIGDVKCALGWVAANGAHYWVDPSRISVMGYSAGGNLALLAAYSPNVQRLPPSCEVPAVAVRAVVNLYGPTELTLAYRASGSLAYGQKALREYLGGTPAEYPQRYRTFSPLTHVGAKTPPTLTLLGTSDRIVTPEQAKLLDQALARAGVAHETWLLPGNDHAFDVNWGGFGTQFARVKIEQFLQRYDGR